MEAEALGRRCKDSGATRAAPTHTPTTASAHAAAPGVPATSRARERAMSQTPLDAATTAALASLGHAFATPAKASRTHAARRASGAPRGVAARVFSGRAFASFGCALMARVSLARARPRPLASAPREFSSSSSSSSSSPPFPRFPLPAAGSSVACVHSLSKGAPTPAPSTGDASRRRLYSRNASARCGARALVQKSEGANGVTSSRSATPQLHDLRHSIVPIHRAAVSITPRAHPLPVPRASSCNNTGSTPFAGDRLAGWSASNKTFNAGHAFSRMASETALASQLPLEEPGAAAAAAACLATVAVAATSRKALRRSLVRNGKRG